MFAILLFVTESAFVRPHEEKSFISHMRRYNLVYTGDEYHFRFGLFLSRQRFIQEFNKAEHSFKVGMNHLATLTPFEYKAMLATKVVTRGVSGVTSSKAAPPDSWDWRDKNAVPAVSSPLSCSTWAFVTVRAAESGIFLKTGTMYVLSEQNLVDCVDSCFGCEGGLPSDAYDYVVQQQSGHFNLESDYPSNQGDGKCHFADHPPVGTITGYATVATGDEMDLQNKIYSIGPSTAGGDASHTSFQLYTGGIYDEPACSSVGLDHSMVIVGYGVEGSKPYWILQNSWGTSWGEQGYIRMIRNKNNQCGVASSVAIPVPG
jgi:cathepsin L